MAHRSSQAGIVLSPDKGAAKARALLGARV